MEVQIGETFDDFRNYVKLLKTINEEMTLQFNEEGIHVASMDPSHVAMIVSTLKPEIFQSFTVDKEEQVTVNLGEVMKFLDRIRKDEKVKIRHDVEKAQLVIHCSKGGHRRRFEIPILEPLEEEMPQPKLVFKASSRIFTQSVERAIKDAMLVAEHIKLEITKEQVEFSARGDIGSTYSNWTKESDELLDFNAEEESHSTYTLSYLNDMINALKPISEVVKIQLSIDMPLNIVADAAAYCEVDLYLAPGIGV